MYISFRIIDDEAKRTARSKRRTPSHMARERNEWLLLLRVYTINRMNRFLSPSVFSATNDFSIYHISIAKFIIIIHQRETFDFSHASSHHSAESRRHQTKYSTWKMVDAGKMQTLISVVGVYLCTQEIRFHLNSRSTTPLGECGGLWIIIIKKRTKSVKWKICFISFQSHTERRVAALNGWKHTEVLGVNHGLGFSALILHIYLSFKTNCSNEDIEYNIAARIW